MEGEYISIIIPVYNEEESISPLYLRIKNLFDGLDISKYEIIFIDDGSKDLTFQKVLNIKKIDSNVKVIKFKNNFGQTSAIDAGFKYARGDIIITIDGDLQNDPKDIPRLINKLEQNYDCVSGWRYNRKDTFSKRFFAQIAYVLRKIIINDKIHDSGCTLKVYKRKCIIVIIVITYM